MVGCQMSQALGASGWMAAPDPNSDELLHLRISYAVRPAQAWGPVH